MFVLRVDTSKARSIFGTRSSAIKKPYGASLIPPNYGVKLYTKIMHNRAFLRAKDHRTSLPGPYSIIQYRIREMRVRSFH